MLRAEELFILHQLPGAETLAQTEQQARLLAFTAEKAQTYLGELGARMQQATPLVRRAYPLDTVADVARSMRGTLEAHFGWWS
jgi:hypothetical protein